jgi:hypothetical protein
MVDPELVASQVAIHRRVACLEGSELDVTLLRHLDEKCPGDSTAATDALPVG